MSHCRRDGCGFDAQSREYLGFPGFLFFYLIREEEESNGIVSISEKWTDEKYMCNIYLHSYTNFIKLKCVFD